MPKLPKSHELIAEAFDRVSSLPRLLSKPFAMDPKSIIAWGRPKPTAENATFTGRNNLIGRLEKFLTLQHPYDPEMARKIAEHFPMFVDELDRQAGFDEAEEIENPCAALGRVVESSAKLVKSSLNGCDDPEILEEALRRTQILKSHVLQLESCLKRNLQINGGSAEAPKKKEMRPVLKKRK